MDVTIIEKPELKAVVLKTNQSGRDVRKAWQEIQKLLQRREIKISNNTFGYVFVPEWQWATGVKELWVGVEVDAFTQEFEGLERFVLPAQRYAQIRVYGDREQMNKTYTFLNDWFVDQSYQRNVSKGSFSLEVNRLQPVNPFDIPADEIDFFDFDIYAPIQVA